jgi:GNAT superfamily N-acetyltransferase
MLETASRIKASLEAGLDLLKPPALVPIRTLSAHHVGRITAHLLTLDATDRYYRFGYRATDEQIERYVAQLDFERDEVLGVFNRKLDLVAVAHLAFVAPPVTVGSEGAGLDAPPGSRSDDCAPCTEGCAEFGVSVAKDARGLGLGSHLFERAATSARNRGVRLMFIHALSENAAMLHIAMKAGAHIKHIGAESEAFLHLDAANLDSRLSELLDEQLAQVDYRLKARWARF